MKTLLLFTEILIPRTFREMILHNCLLDITYQNRRFQCKMDFNTHATKDKKEHANTYSPNRVLTFLIPLPFPVLSELISKLIYRD